MNEDIVTDNRLITYVVRLRRHITEDVEVPVVAMTIEGAREKASKRRLDEDLEWQFVERIHTTPLVVGARGFAKDN